MDLKVVARNEHPTDPYYMWACESYEEGLWREFAEQERERRTNRDQVKALAERVRLLETELAAVKEATDGATHRD